VPSALGLTSPFSIAPAFKNASSEPQQPLASNSFGYPAHQFFAIDSIKEFFKIEINSLTVPFSSAIGDGALCDIVLPRAPETGPLRFNAEAPDRKDSTFGADRRCSSQSSFANLVTKSDCTLSDSPSIYDEIIDSRPVAFPKMSRSPARC
jgi:hypothetical protein